MHSRRRGREQRPRRPIPRTRPTVRRIARGRAAIRTSHPPLSHTFALASSVPSSIAVVASLRSLTVIGVWAGTKGRVDLAAAPRHVRPSGATRARVRAEEERGERGSRDTASVQHRESIGGICDRLASFLAKLIFRSPLRACTHRQPQTPVGWIELSWLHVCVSTRWFLLRMVAHAAAVAGSPTG